MKIFSVTDCPTDVKYEIILLCVYNVPMDNSVYIESSVISYLTARPSRDVVTSARQAIMLEWWED